MPELLFFTEPDMNGKDIMEFCPTCFQIEFCFRDAEGFTGLMQSQASDVAKLSFNANRSLSPLNPVKEKALFF